MDDFLDDYHDRKMLKWYGFYLSEHTATVGRVEKERNQIWPQKPKQTGAEINQILEEATSKNQLIALQKEVLDSEGNYLPDIVGNVKGFDSEGIYIDEAHVGYEEIRNVRIVPFRKWSQLD